MRLSRGRHRARVGRLPYLIAVPFSANWTGGDEYELITAPPRQLAHLARKDELDVACVPITEVRSLSKRFEPLGDLGLAVHGDCSVARLFSRVEADLLRHAQIGTSLQAASTSVLLELVLVHRFGLTSPNLVELTPDRQHLGAFLLVGDEALKLMDGSVPTFDHEYDVIAQWQEWTQLPFVLARWVVRKTLPDAEKEEILALIEGALTSSLDDPKPVVEQYLCEQGLSFNPEEALRFIQGCRYRLGDTEEKAIDHFLKLEKEFHRRDTSWRQRLHQLDPFNL